MRQIGNLNKGRVVVVAEKKIEKISKNLNKIWIRVVLIK